MKNPLKHLKHMWKDPINTIDEANKRKKEVLPWFISFIIATLLCGVLNVIIEQGFLLILGMVTFMCAFIFGFMLWIVKKAKEKFAALTCDKCNTLAEIKTPEDYAKYVSYTIESHEAIYKGISHPSSNNGVVTRVTASGTSNAVVWITLKCPKCGNVKQLKYVITPFKCSLEEKNVKVRDIEVVKMKLDNAVKAVVEDYNDVDNRHLIPYSIHSKKNPKYDQRTKPQLGKDTVAFPIYNGVKIEFRKDVEEMVDAFFLENMIDGKIIDPNKPQKSK